MEPQQQIASNPIDETPQPIDAGKAEIPKRNSSRIGRLLAGAAIAAASLTAGANIADGNIGGAVDAAVEQVGSVITGDDHRLSIDIDAGMQTIGIGGIKLPGLDISVTGSDHHKGTQQVLVTRQVEDTISKHVVTPSELEVRTDDINMEWARLFSADPSSETPSQPPEINAVVERVAQLKEQGWKVSVQVQGFASMEDDTPDAHPELHNPGFEIPSTKNQELADTRAAAVKGIMDPLLVDSAGNPTTIDIVPGLETDDPVLAADIMNYASTHGIDVVQLVKAYNRHPETLPDDAVKLLDGLKDERVVRVTVVASKPGSSKDIIVNSSRTVLDVVTQPVDEKEEDGGNIKLVPMIIPWVGLGALALLRRKKGEDEITDPPPGGKKDELFKDSRTKPQTGITIRPKFRNKQPRPHNYNRGNDRMGRSSGGDRRGKRG